MEKWNRGKFIGKGSYGSVCIGIRESDGCNFAVKSADKNSLSSIEALENEIKILRSLSSSSPFIIEYYGDDETTSHRNLHMEYLPGGDVAKSGGVSDVDLIRSYTWCLVMALKEVHSKGVVHCDVKGSNVLVGSSYGVVKLSDFGSSIKVGDETHDDYDYDYDQRVRIVPRGSPLWMAPEVVRGESQGSKSDIWSIGCTVIEMFTGVPAWQDCGVHHTLMKIGYSDELPQYPARLPELAKDFLNKCLTRNPGQRWSCDQLLQHPFLLPVPTSKITDHDTKTPRSILDWQNLDFSDDDDNDNDDDDEHRSDEVSVRGRMGELATTRGVNWESDGWVEVRSVRKEILVQEEEVSAGTSWEYSELVEGEIGNSTRVVWEIQDNDYPTWINSSAENNNDERTISGGDGGVRCDYGDLCGGVTETYVSKNLHLSLLLSLFVLYSFTRNKDLLCKYEYYCYIGLLLLLDILFWSLFPSWNVVVVASWFNMVYFKNSSSWGKKY